MVSSRRNPPGTAINDLPNELLDRIFGSFATYRDPEGKQVDKSYVYGIWHENRPTLKNLALVSNRFRHIAEPHLYRAFCYDAHHKALRRFVQTLLARPNLARNVKLVYLDSWSDEDMSFEDDSWRETAMRAGFAGEEQTRFMADMSKGGLFADIILLLTMATRLAVLGLEITYDPTPWLSPFLLRQARIQRASNLEPEGPLHRLEQAELWHWDTEGGFEPGAFAELLHLPSLQHVTSFMCAKNDGHEDEEEGGGAGGGGGEEEEEDEERPKPVWPEAGTSNVTSISLFESLVTGKAVGRLLSRCKAIKSFEYHLGGAVVGYYDISFAGLWPHLYPLGHSLEALTIKLDEYDDQDHDDPTTSRLALRHFPRLKRLAVPQVFLLPPSGLHDVDPALERERRDDTAVVVRLRPPPPAYRRIAEGELPASLESLAVLDRRGNALDLLCFLRALS